jgi:sortase A
MRQRQTMNRKQGRLHLGHLLAGIVLLMVSALSSADTQLWIQDPYTSDSVLTSVTDPDTSLWNAARIVDYEESLKADTAPPLGILTIEKLNIQVPIYNGTDDFTLDRGAGRIKGMAKMDEDANLGISGHRDGFFRSLKDIAVGDDIDIQTTRGVEKYAVTAINIVPKADVSVLDPKSEKTLTLVTCYPFYFVGHAPKRYIVTAIPKSPGYD